MCTTVAWPVLLAAASFAASSPCASDDDCSLNGICQRNGVCACFAPWRGSSCGVLDELPGPRRAAFGVNCDTANCSAPHTASWGGSVVHDGSNYHLFVSQLTQDCPLSHWMTNMDVAHAVSSSPLGPFKQRDTALAPFSTNPEVVLDEHGDWWMFHIGSADNHTNQTNCQPSAVVTAHKQAVAPPPTPLPGVVHKAPGPDGPWIPHPSVDCNNPSPALAKLGVRGASAHREARLMCSSPWRVQRSMAGFGGPWEEPLLVKTNDARGGARWEDPFLWQDIRGHWHVLAHVFLQRPCGTSDPRSVSPACNYISGHMFSRDGLTNWTVGADEPYSFNLTYADGTSGLVSTRERPKLLFDPTTGEPTHLYTAAAPMPPKGCLSCTKPRKPEDARACVGCKTSDPWGSGVYTMVVPLRQQSETERQPQGQPPADEPQALDAFDCPSCDQVPCGQCQEGCPISSVGCDPSQPGATSRNGCKDGNRGCHPSGCSKPDPDPPAPPLAPGASLCDDRDSSDDGSPGWRRVFADEFNGDALDNATWGSDMGWDTLSSLREAKNVRENIVVENGTLVLRSLRQRAPPYTEGIPAILYGNRTWFNYTSAAVTTNGKRAFGGGGRTTRVCVRAQLPGGDDSKGYHGYWPAHWLLPEGCPAGCSPHTTGCSAAELDVMEMVNGDGIAHATYHSQPNCSVSPHNLHDGNSVRVSNFSSVFAEYAVEFSPTSAKFFVDGREILNVPECPKDTGERKEKGRSSPLLPRHRGVNSQNGTDTHCGHFFDVGYYLLLNTAIGGPWPQEPDAATHFPGYHRVDWVRVAERQ